MKIERKGKGTGRKKNKKRKLPEEKENSESRDGSNMNKKFKSENSSNPSNNKTSNENEQTKRHRDGKDFQKKTLKDKTGQVVGEGEGLFQGFRVKQQDVKRLQKLQKELKSDKTLKDEDVNATLKRERRKAERVLANFHKMVCFNCRKPGHLLVDCPDTSNAKHETSSSNVSLQYQYPILLKFK